MDSPRSPQDFWISGRGLDSVLDFEVYWDG